MHTFHFDDQYHTHFSYGYSIAPGGQEIVGDQEAFLNKKGVRLASKGTRLMQMSWGTVKHVSICIGTPL